MINSKQLTVTIIEHEKSGIITAFVNELPGVLVQGSDEDDATVKLRSLLNTYIQRLRSMDDNFTIKRERIA